MDLYSFLNIQVFLIVPIVCYILFFRKHSGRNLYTNRDIFYPVKYYLSRRIVKKFQEKRKKKRLKYGLTKELECKRFASEETSYYQSFHGCDQKGNSLSLRFTVRPSKIAEVILQLRLSNGKVYSIPGSNKVLLGNIKENQWKINGLLIDNLEPYKRVRIIYNGLLQDVSCTTYEKIEHIQFNFIFNCCSSPQFFPEDNNIHLLTEAIATSVWKDASWKYFLEEQSKGYDQFGALLGFVKGDPFPEEQILNLPACRSKYLGPDDRYTLKRGIKIFLAEVNGVLINLNLKLFTNGDTHLNYGQIIHKHNDTVPIRKQDLRIQYIGRNKSLPELFVVNIKTQKDEYTCVVNLRKSSQCSAGSEEDFELINIPAECNVNARQGKALVDFWYYENKNVKLPQLPPLLAERRVKNLPPDLVVNIKEEHARIVELTGGKGTSLALLSSLNSQEFTVPDGIILTINAFRRQLSTYPALDKVVEMIEEVFTGKSNRKREEVCADAVYALQNEAVELELCRLVFDELNKVKAGGGENVSWAVRSSAIGEDSEELSAAGQNETILGCVTDEEIKRAISSCWASLFTYQSVQYRWQHGLPIRTDMAVVIQRMVPSDAAGVLFTWHPSTSNPSQMVITSNYGLGESVVSGNSEPDTFVLNRTYEGKVCLLDQIIGSKTKVITLTTSGIKEIDNDDGLIEDFVKVEDNNSANWSITKEQAIQLGKIGITLEKAFGGPRDIEWAFFKGNLYLLQSRPITTLNTWTEFELTHEFDTPLITENTILTMANVGEVYPLPISALGQSIVDILDGGIQMRINNRVNPFVKLSVVSASNRMLLDVVLTIHKNAKPKIQMSSRILDVAIFGHSVINETINQIIIDRLGIVSTPIVMKELLTMLKIALTIRKRANESTKIAESLDCGIQSEDDIETMLYKINDCFNTLLTLCNNHSTVSSISVFWQMICMNILIGDNTELTSEHYTDFANILLSCDDVVSAEIPVYLENIAGVIINQGLAEEFSQVAVESGVDWLRVKCPEAHIICQEFLSKHGHRTLGEFELSEKTWGLDPSKVIPMIQANCLYMRGTTKNYQTTDQIIKRLVSPVSSGKKKFLKFVISKLRTAVGLREHTKSAVVLGINKTRLAILDLAKKLVKNGILPSEDLIFHLTLHEINEVTTKKSPLLIMKAIQRQRLYSKWNKLKFSEIIYGFPQPINDIDDIPIELQSGTKCVGTPACIGNVQARACVITSLNEIDQLEKGDILITYSTDIGWSPYFPMLSGVVTELGGLISHGAVVAREYGLPCIVGVKNVTKIFKTGDIVHLSGRTGELGKVE